MSAGGPMTSDGELCARAPSEVPPSASVASYRWLAERMSAAGMAVDCAALVFEIGADGLRAAVVDVRTGHALVERLEPSVSPRLLDRAVAEHLIALDRVARPDTPEWAGELIDLLPDVRARVAGGAGAFAMGREHVGMFRVVHDDLDVAWASHRAAVAALGQSVIADLPSVAPPHVAPPSVAVVGIGPGCDRWPGLLDEAVSVLDLPLLLFTYARTNGSVGAHALQQDSAGTPDTPPFVADPSTGTEDPPMTPDGPRYYMPPTRDAPRPGAPGRRIDRRLVIGAGAVGVSAAIGAVIVATPWISGSSDSVPAQAAATSDVPASAGASEPVTTSERPPLDLGAARAPIVAYTAPAPVATRNVTPTPNAAPRPRVVPRPAPRHRTIPNPIPGLPPIVLP